MMPQLSLTAQESLGSYYTSKSNPAMDITLLEKTSPISLHQLPVELIVEIFQWAIFGIDRAWWRHRQAFRVSQINRRLRKVACEAASLWTTLILPPHGVAGSHPTDYFKMLAIRSMPYALEVAISPRSLIQFDPFLSICRIASDPENMIRVSDLYLSIDMATGDKLLISESAIASALIESLYSTQLNQLTRLSLRWDTSRFKGRSMVFLPDAPNLTSLEVDGHIDVEWSTAPHYPRLRSMHRRDVSLSGYSAWRAMESMSDFFKFLERNEAITMLELDFSDFNNVVLPSETLSLPQLQDLRIPSMNQLFFHNVMFRLQSPRLRLLDLGYLFFLPNIRDWALLPEQSIGKVEQLVYRDFRHSRREEEPASFRALVDRLTQCSLKSLLTVKHLDLPLQLSYAMSELIM